MERARSAMEREKSYGAREVLWREKKSYGE